MKLALAFTLAIMGGLFLVENRLDGLAGWTPLLGLVALVVVAITLGRMRLRPTDEWTAQPVRARVISYLKLVVPTVFVLGCGFTTCTAGLVSVFTPLNTVEEFDPVSNTWAAKAPMPTARLSAGIAEINGRIYAVGGSANGKEIGSVDQYDTVSNTWTTRAALPQPRNLLGLAATGGKLYAIGGTINGYYTNSVQMYDPALNTWTARAAMPTGRYGLGLAEANGKLYAIGGAQWNTNRHFYLSAVEEYDPVANTWTPKASLPTPRGDFGIASIAGKIYVAGGNGGPDPDYGRPLTSVLVFDPLANSWTPAASLPGARFAFGMAASGGKLYVAGGRSGAEIQTGYVTSSLEYNPATNSWTERAALPTRRQLLGLAPSPSGKLYAIGGTAELTTKNLDQLQAIEDATGAKPTASINFAVVRLTGVAALFIGGSDKLDCAVDEIWRHELPKTQEYFGYVEAGGWRKVGTLKNARLGTQAVSLPNGSVFVAGGWTGCAPSHHPLTTTERLGILADGTVTSTLDTPMSIDRADHVMTMVPYTVPAAARVLVAGGYSAISGTLASAALYNPSTASWTPTGSMNQPRWLAQGVWLNNGKFLVAGGGYTDFTGDVVTRTAELYDPVSGTWTPTGSMQDARVHHSLVLLSNGFVMVSGGTSSVLTTTAALSSTEFYNPATGLWTPTVGGLNTPRMLQSMTAVSTTSALASAVLATKASITPRTALGPLVGTGSLLTSTNPTSTVFVVGGMDRNGKALDSIEVYDPTTDEWVQLPVTLNTGRYGHLVTLDGVRISIALGRTDLSASPVLTAEDYSSMNVGIRGPNSVVSGTPFTYTADVVSVLPVSFTVPITYVWQATGRPTVVHVTNAITDVVTFTWPVTGTFRVTVTAANLLGSLSGSMPVTASGTAAGNRVFIPIATDAHQGGW